MVGITYNPKVKNLKIFLKVWIIKVYFKRNLIIHKKKTKMRKIIKKI